MQVLEENSAPAGGVVLIRRRPMRAAAIAGGFGALLALVPLFIAPGLEPSRFLTFVVLMAASGALMFLGRTRSERIVLLSKPGGLVWGDEPLPPPAYVVLSGNDREEPPQYQALIGWSDGRERLALERGEPALLLRDALALARRLGLDVQPGWGLERHFPRSGFAEAWESAAHDASGLEPLRKGPVELAVWPVQMKAATTCLAAGVFVPVVTVFLARSPDRSVTPSLLELVLTLLSAGFGSVLGVFFLGLRRRVELTARGLESTFVLFGKVLGKPRELTPKPGRAFAVTPDRGFVRHLLVATSGDPISIVSDPDAAKRLVAAEPASSERVAAELPLVTSARYSRPDRPARLRS